MHQRLNFLHVLRSNATVKSADVTGRPDAACGSEFPPLSSQNAVGGREWCVPGAVSVSVAEQSQCVYTWQCLQIPVVTEHSKCRHLNSQFNHPNGILSFGNSEETFLFSYVDSWHILIKWIFEPRDLRGGVSSPSCDVVTVEAFWKEHSWGRHQLSNTETKHVQGPAAVRAWRPPACRGVPWDTGSPGFGTSRD